MLRPPPGRGHGVARLEQAIEITGVVIPHPGGHVGHRQVGVGQQVFGLGEPLVLHQLREVAARAPLDQPAEPVHVAFQLRRQLGQLPVAVSRLHIPKRREHRVAVEIPPPGLQPVGAARQLLKQQAHGGLLLPGVLLVEHQRPDHVLHQVLNRQHVRHAEVQIARAAGLAAETAHQKPADQSVPLPQHPQRHVKELRQQNQVHRQIPLPRRLDLLHRAGAHHQYLARVQLHPLAVDVVHGLALRHVHHLHIVVPVGRKADEPRVRPQHDVAPRPQQLAAVHGGRRALHVQLPLDLRLARQNPRLLAGDPAEPVQNPPVHATASRPHYSGKPPSGKASGHKKSAALSSCTAMW